MVSPFFGLTHLYTSPMLEFQTSHHYSFEKICKNFLKAAMIRKIYKNQRTITQVAIIHPKQLFVHSDCRILAKIRDFLFFFYINTFLF